MFGESAEKRVRTALHAHYVARLASQLPADIDISNRRTLLETATKAAAPDVSPDDIVSKLTEQGLPHQTAAALVASARDLGPDIEKVVQAEKRAQARAEAAFLPRIVGGLILGMGAIAVMAFWERLGFPSGAILLALMPQALAAGLILFGLFDRQKSREARQSAETIRSSYHARREAEDQ